LKRHHILFTIFIFGLLAFANTLHAKPAPPVISYTTSGITLSISWTDIADADGYTLFYAPYPSASPINNIDMGSQTSLTGDLVDGAAFYIAVQAYNNTGNSNFSNLEYFVIGGQINTNGCATYNGLIWEVKSDDIIALRSNQNTLSWYDPKIPSGQEGPLWGCMSVLSTDGATDRCDTDSYIQAINKQGLCGYSDWRLPTITELESLMVVGNSPKIDNQLFPNTIGANAYYWSSTSTSIITADDSAWVLNFDDGQKFEYLKSMPAQIRLVRSVK